MTGRFVQKLENVKIEKNIPMLDRRPYALVKKMDIGDSFQIELSSLDIGRLRNSFESYIRRQKLGYKLAHQRISSTHFRIWRIK
jgi:hypothetical protein